MTLLGQTLTACNGPLLAELITDGLIDVVEFCPDAMLRSESGRKHLRARLAGLGVPYSFHFTELQIGSPDFLRRWSQEEWRLALADFEPIVVSAHVSASIVGSFKYEGNLPCVHNERGLATIVENATHLAQALPCGTPLLLENIPCQFEFTASTMTHEDFVLAVVELSPAELLLDLCNLYVHVRNRHVDPFEVIEAIPASFVQEIHLAGGEVYPASGEYLDTHSRPVPGEVFELFEVAMARFNPALVVIEREQEFGSAEHICRDLERARAIIERHGS